MDELKVLELQPGVAQLYVPITFMIDRQDKLHSLHGF
jgi:hypothetical protein